ncbi:MAG: ABC transporter permease [Patescibacteria group bacterium]|nr:ABC transporter permease [Patescibacteria group bacterium]MBU0880089.1 ABC transporter permease [Patescibacteria group bacterium]MBU1062852.1 ABC transporter permease [Patescibacteria group bacterium]MBU1783497.1 ABC transporter permease [Patescibacteria group bacterium]MBU2214790.1 ABC transporter permease [Patescibacteria group bacterium]
METIIRPKKTFSWSDISELWQYRELMYFFTWRDLKVRYKQTAVGVAWALFQPFVTMIVFSIFFGNFAKMPSDGIPYPIFVYVGLLIWQFFSGALTETSNCLIANQSIITKVYFPRLILPISAVLTKLVDFFIASIILIGMMIYYGYTPNLLGLLILPILLFISFLASVGGGLFLAAVNVKYRDVRYILPFFIQILMFITPVIYPASIAGKYSWILALNPMTGVIKAAHAAILGNAPINWQLLGISFITTLILFVIGVIYFKKTERYFADII